LYGRCIKWLCRAKSLHIGATVLGRFHELGLILSISREALSAWGKNERIAVAQTVMLSTCAVYELNHCACPQTTPARTPMTNVSRVISSNFAPVRTQRYQSREDLIKSHFCLVQALVYVPLPLRGIVMSELINRTRVI
jgi:hypothetical protein